MISNLDRNKIIQYKDKRIAKFDNIKTLFFQLPFSFNYMNIEKFFLNFNLNSSFFSNFLQNCNLRLINKMNPSIARIFIHDFKINKPCFFKYGKFYKLFYSKERLITELLELLLPNEISILKENFFSCQYL